MASFDRKVSSSERLWRLIAARSQRGADTASIDQRIWDQFGDEWAIMFTDLSGFSRQVARFGITHFLQIIWEQQQLLLPVVEAHDGILVKIEADSFLLLFKHAHQALTCAQAMQRQCANVNARRAPEEQIVLCVGIGYGTVLKIGDDDVFGHEVNLASKLGEDIARGGEILLSPGAHRSIEGGPAREEVAHAYVGEDRYWKVVG